jgi:quinolinate synthase
MLGRRSSSSGTTTRPTRSSATPTFTGDSLKLSQIAAKVASERDVKWVVFCGVHFMAESADMLTPESVDVILPDLSAGCSMADMAQYDDTVRGVGSIHRAGRGGWKGAWCPSPT